MILRAFAGHALRQARHLIGLLQAKEGVSLAGLAGVKKALDSEAVSSLLGDNLPTLHWSDFQRWRYAHPCAAAKIEDTVDAAEIGLFFAGDAFVGKGRVPGALETGLAAARRIIETF